MKKTSPLEYLIAGLLLVSFGWLPIIETQPMFALSAPWWIEYMLYPLPVALAIYLFEKFAEKLLIALRRFLRPPERVSGGFSHVQC